MGSFERGGVPLGSIKWQNDQLGSHELSRMFCSSLQHNLSQSLWRPWCKSMAILVASLCPIHIHCCHWSLHYFLTMQWTVTSGLAWDISHNRTLGWFRVREFYSPLPVCCEDAELHSTVYYFFCFCIQYVYMYLAASHACTWGWGIQTTPVWCMLQAFSQ